MYRNLKNPLNIDYLEEKLADLEHETSHIIRAIHLGLQLGCTTLTRGELATLRKFMFLMHYRNDTVSATYFHEHNPLNAPLAEWIKVIKQRRQLQTEVDVWLDGLKYYLDTPHHVIVAAGESLRERYGDQRLQEMLRKRFDPDTEDEWYAIDYESDANYFFLGVWEAADNSDFILSGNGFGVWEGLIYGSPRAHRIYVVSPRIALVLRRTCLHQPQSNDPSALYSSLSGVPIPKPIIKYVNEELLKNVDHDDPWSATTARNTYRMTSEAQKDSFTFSFTKLTCQQTFAINEVIMMNANLHNKGSITFATPDTMRQTLETYMASHNTFLGGKRALFHPLLVQLTRMTADRVSASLNTTNIPLLPPLEKDSDADRQLHTFLRFILLNQVTFPSSYTRAYLIFHMATDALLSNSVSNEIRRIRDDSVNKLRFFLDPPLHHVPSNAPSQPDKLVESMVNEESQLFFALVGHLVDCLQISTYSNDFLANIIYEAAIIGVALVGRRKI